MSYTRLCVLLCAPGLCAVSAFADPIYTPPAGGWAYIYNGDLASPVLTAALDGTWNADPADSGSTQWDGSAPGFGAPGGAGTFTDPFTLDTVLRVQDAGNPTDHGFADPSNRKLYFTHDVATSGFSSTLLDDGVTISFRARLATPLQGLPLDDVYPDGGGAVTPWPIDGDGYNLHDGGKGMFGVRQGAGDRIVSVSLATAAQDGAPQDSLVVGGQNMPVSPLTDYHEFWIAIQADTSGGGTHQVSVYADGAMTPTVFNVTAGGGNDGPFSNYIAMGLGSTGQTGAVDVDFFAVHPGALAPDGSSIAPPAPVGNVSLSTLPLSGAGEFQLPPGTLMDSSVLNASVDPGSTTSERDIKQNRDNTQTFFVDPTVFSQGINLDKAFIFYEQGPGAPDQQTPFGWRLFSVSDPEAGTLVEGTALARANGIAFPGGSPAAGTAIFDFDDVVLSPGESYGIKFDTQDADPLIVKWSRQDDWVGTGARYENEAMQGASDYAFGLIGTSIGPPPPPPRLVAYYNFDGNTADQTGHGYDGTAMGDAAFNADVPAQLGGGQSMAFDGAGDYVDLGNPNEMNFSTTDWTVAGWVKTTQAGQTGTLFSNGGDNSGGVRYVLAQNETTDGMFTLTVDDNADKVQAESTTVTNDDQWHYVLARRKGDRIDLFVDGQLEDWNGLPANYNLAGTSQLPAQIGAGRAEDSTPPGALLKDLNGLADDVAVWSAALPADVIRSLAAGDLSPLDAPLSQGPVILSATRGGSSTNTLPAVQNGALFEDMLTFTDRTHEYNDVPDFLLDADYVQVANDDRNVPDYVLDVELATDADLYLFIDNRVGDDDNTNGPTLGGGLMDWVANLGFVDTGEDIGIDESGDGDIDQFGSIFLLPNVPAGTIQLFAQDDGTSRNMYGVAAVGVGGAGAAIPEPSTWALLMLGAAGLLLVRRRAAR